MVALPREKLRAEEFLRWGGRETDDRFELVNGEVVMMSPERVRYVHVKTHAWLALRNALAHAGVECVAHGDGVAVKIDDLTVRQPDVSVQCKPAAPDSVFLDEPLILVEVVSPSSGRSDTGAKLAEYFRIDSVRHYLILDPDKNVAIHHRRESATGDITTTILAKGAVELSPPGILMMLDDVFGEVDR